jgi:hypothetical protein
VYDCVHRHDCGLAFTLGHPHPGWLPGGLSEKTVRSTLPTLVAHHVWEALGLGWVWDRRSCHYQDQICNISPGKPGNCAHSHKTNAFSWTPTQEGLRGHAHFSCMRWSPKVSNTAGHKGPHSVEQPVCVQRVDYPSVRSACSRSCHSDLHRSSPL